MGYLAASFDLPAVTDTKRKKVGGLGRKHNRLAVVPITVVLKTAKISNSSQKEKKRRRSNWEETFEPEKEK